MNWMNGIAAGVFGAVMTVACVSPEGAPPSARRPIEASADGLFQLFQEECIEQRSLVWVRDESERLRAGCGFLQNAGETGDCQQRNDGEVSWSVSTTTGPSVVVRMFWPIGQTPQQKLGPPDRRLSCSIHVTENLGPALRDAAFRLAQVNGSFAEPSHDTEGAYQHWIWSPVGHPRSTPQLQLFQYDPAYGDRTWELKYAVWGPFPENPS